MNKAQFKDRLEWLGRQLGPGDGIEFNVVGGAAGLLTGILPDYMTTGDMDVVHMRPPKEVEEVLLAAQQVSDAMGILRGWISADAGLFANALPADWESRRILVGQFGRLRVYAIGRLDLIATKFYAQRTRDFEHLRELKVTSEEKAFVEKHLRELPAKLPEEAGKIGKALHILGGWR